MSEQLAGRAASAPGPARSRIWLAVAAVVLGLVALALGYLVLAATWGLSQMYGNPAPITGTPWALLPALALAGCLRCVLGLTGRAKPRLILLVVVCAAVLGTATYGVGVAGDRENRAYQLAQTDVALQGQRDVLLALPMNRAEGGAAVGSPTCETDRRCSIGVWVPGGSTAESLATMTAQMEAAGWTTREQGESSATYAGALYVLEATVTQEDDKGGTDFRVAVIK